MIKKGKAYLHEYFASTFTLCGKIANLEEIKGYIIKMYVEKGLLVMIKPTYSQKPLSVVIESGYCGRALSSAPGECYLGFILWGEPSTQNR